MIFNTTQCQVISIHSRTTTQILTIFSACFLCEEMSHVFSRNCEYDAVNEKREIEGTGERTGVWDDEGR